LYYTHLTEALDEDLVQGRDGDVAAEVHSVTIV
jgi:hypothetical protein